MRVCRHAAPGAARFRQLSSAILWARLDGMQMDQQGTPIAFDSGHARHILF
ncbi:hypothetical protein ARMA_0496 [Ardenticatena maritima]|uniref:Uncharacterized protein n=1 Tax=Ardenticatena maritima TaxID=872965 RepID=A0A0M8K5F3_9CHLR|nr:hypothetical protein ARMA_0496 [Ardenticatena maritima]